MRIAYLVMTHQNPRLLRRVTEKLSSEDSAFFIHVDAKSDLAEFSGIACSNVHFVEKRVPVYWGEFSVVDAVLRLLRQATTGPTEYDYVVLLSGSDYPLWSRDYISCFLRENRGTEFMSIVRMPCESAGQPLSKINRIWIQSNKPVRRLVMRALAKLGLARRDYRRFLGDLEPYAGDMWWALTADACRYILDFVERNQSVRKYFETTPAPDEMFFHTILGNSPYASRLRRNLVYTDWSAGGSHPALIDEKHISFFAAHKKVSVNSVFGPGEALFARKFSDDRLDLLDKIDAMILRKESKAPSQTRE